MRLRTGFAFSLLVLGVSRAALAADVQTPTYYQRLKDAAGGATGAFTTSGVDLVSTAGAIVGGLLGLLGIVFLVLTIYAGVQWMTAGGNEEQIKSAKALLFNAVIGLTIILASVVLVNFIFKFFGFGAPSSAPTTPAQ